MAFGNSKHPPSPILKSQQRIYVIFSQYFWLFQLRKLAIWQTERTPNRFTKKITKTVKNNVLFSVIWIEQKFGFSSFLYSTVTGFRCISEENSPINVRFTVRCNTFFCQILIENCKISLKRFWIKIFRRNMFLLFLLLFCYKE